MLRKAHGHGFQGYWRLAKVDETPSLEALTARLAFLRGELGLDEAALRKFLSAFPESLGLDVAQVMRPNVVRLRCMLPLACAATQLTRGARTVGVPGAVVQADGRSAARGARP